MPIRLERSQRPGSASSAARMGLAKASPTMTQALTLSRSTVSSSSTGSKLAGGQGHHPPALAQGLEGGEAAGAVHERAGGKQASSPARWPRARPGRRRCPGPRGTGGSRRR